MGYQRGFYKSDAGSVYHIRVSDATAASDIGKFAAGPTTDGKVEVKVGGHGSKRKYGIFARGFVLKRRVGTAPDQFYRTSFIPCPDPANFTDAKIGTNITLNGNIWTVYDKVQEA